MTDVAQAFTDGRATCARTIRYRYVNTIIDRHGNPHYYLRRGGHPLVRLPRPYGSPEFLAAYFAALDGAAPEIGPPAEPESKQEAARGKPGPKPALRVGHPGYVYFLRVGRFVKIGYSARPMARLGNLQTTIPDDVTSFVFFKAGRDMERRLHAYCGTHRANGEWFRAQDKVIRLMARAAANGCLAAVDFE